MYVILSLYPKLTILILHHRHKGIFSDSQEQASISATSTQQ